MRGSLRIRRAKIRIFYVKLDAMAEDEWLVERLRGTLNDRSLTARVAAQKFWPSQVLRQTLPKGA